MKNNSLNKRFGGAVLIVIVVIVIIAAAVGAYFGYKYYSGKELQERQTKLWAEAFTLFNQKQPEAAYLKLNETRLTFNDNLEFYRKNASESSYLSKNEVDEIKNLRN